MAETKLCRLWPTPGLFNPIIFLSFRGKLQVWLLGFSNITSERVTSIWAAILRILLQSSRLILKGKGISHSISLHVRRQFCFLNAFAVSSTWDLQIHLRSWFARYCWMQDSVMRAQLSIEREAGCQSAPPRLPSSPTNLSLPWISQAGRFWGKAVDLKAWERQDLKAWEKNPWGGKTLTLGCFPISNNCSMTISFKYQVFENQKF